ncbi:helix-turn-helix domain-containing protein [Streptomyces litchfieldiae]|uniref:Helix-turn-helix transcriptional regulator n=1 Tax=Streptomyces litchfieldiae TaxID=3075543 RepID=A0ABU2MMF8_9ACTN|nr:helix-turn-helix transcriptional regulator [Streptomyces sp. DSM 44938]MDT0342785.1 helix-turn-helix transcriptional regulator [Streptomyces sp. DSM 44938]
MITDIESATPALCRLQLGSDLRRLRLAAGLKASQVAKRLLWSPSKLTRLETGENASVEPADVMALCGIYGADEETRALLMDYAAVTKTRRDWWQSAEYRPLIKPGFKAFLGLEATASSLHNYEAEFVPGLLQTEAYVRVIHQRAHPGISPKELDRVVTVRITRQEVLRRTVDPLKLTAIVNEAVLRRRVGDGALMRGQLTHIVELAETLPNVRVQVVPFHAGSHAGMNGKFVVLHFPEGATPRSIVHLENMADAWVSRAEGVVARYEEAFTDLQALAPGPLESLTMIKKAIKEH